jgi:hypothetical protein
MECSAIREIVTLGSAPPSGIATVGVRCARSGLDRKPGTIDSIRRMRRNSLRSLRPATYFRLRAAATGHHERWGSLRSPQPTNWGEL